ncbi:MAG TPA: peptidylprolyl isomerase [Chitinophagaceae bacterium]|jgi:peptidyl-prolyl cis-trans isomerase SurA|nr:peptidylprolyl isomerase [Chitinophagaceae bacterium]
MNKASLLVVAVLIGITASSQTLFTYGKYSVSAPEFVRAYNKNNTQPVTDKAKAMRDYLDLYVNSRLKIREAYERRYDTTPQIRSEVTNLRNQIIENYMSDPETMNRLAKEAFERSQKDIHIGHIFIAIGSPDTAAAYAQAKAVVDRLNKEDFTKVATEASQDPAVASNKGDAGWITVFTLPYYFESAIYALKPGQHSQPIRSKAGYHIFKNIAERKAVGKMKAKQILLAFPPGTDDAVKKQLAKRADSLYARLVAGDSFDNLASTFSNDYLTAITGGSMPDFGVGQYEPAFENKVWALTKDGAMTKPFLTSHGWHIIKRVSSVPVVSDPADKNNEQDLRQKIIMDQRWKTSRDVIYDRVVKLAGLDRLKFQQDALWALTDSILDRRPLGIGSNITQSTPIYKLGDTTLKANDFIIYAQAFRYRPDGTGVRTYPETMNEFLRNTVFQYYRDHLESFNEEFRYQMNEFTDGNLFFEIMQQQIWNRAQSDTAELRALYETNKSKYMWSKSADAVIFFCADANVAKSLHEQLKKSPTKWRELTDALTEKVVADSSRYEWDQIPNKNKAIPTTGMITTPVVNTTDNTASFAYVVKTYPNPTQRNFNEAKGLVINDYQTILEEQWVKELKKKYPVVIDESVWSSIVK